MNVQLAAGALPFAQEGINVVAGLAAGVLSLSPEGRVISANPAALALFAPVDPMGYALRDFLAVCGVSGGDELAAAIAGGGADPHARLQLADGRMLDARSRPVPGGAVMTLLDVTSYVRDAERAFRDPLTGLANRAGLLDHMVARLPALSGAGPGFAVLYLDLDRFKLVNDTLGHAMGDALLLKVAERLRSAVRANDLIARLGGDEFAIVQSDVTQPESAEALSARLVDLIGRTYVVCGQMLNVGVSIGVAVAPHDGLDPDTLLRRADLALYRAKDEGRGQFRFFQPGMDAELQARRGLEIDLRRALALRQFSLAYQPLYEVVSHRLVGFEALLRWQHPERGSVSPADFIPLAEEIGLIVPLGEWVLRTACKEAATWTEKVAIAVNISPMQFRDTDLVAVVRAALAASGLDPSRLELEITEGALLENTERVLGLLRGLRDLGVRLSMDDFGTGYSSLSYLQRFPFDKVKIDQSFVRGAAHDPDCNGIVRAVAALSASLGLTTTAEGVETPAQMEAIRAAGCNQVQGYYTGRPMSATDVVALMCGHTDQDAMEEN